MEHAATTTLRRCLRTSSNRTLRCRPSGGGKCIAMGICPARNVVSSSAKVSTVSVPRGVSLGMERERELQRGKGVRRMLRGFSTQLSDQAAAQDTTSIPSSASSTTSSIEGTIGDGAAKPPLLPPTHLNPTELEIWQLLNKELQAEKLEVQDISGGCGSMYGIEVVSERFRGLGVLKQQRLVNKVLGERIKGWHGVQLRTSAP